jgi:hypothetical protein
MYEVQTRVSGISFRPQQIQSTEGLLKKPALPDKTLSGRKKESKLRRKKVMSYFKM